MIRSLAVGLVLVSATSVWAHPGHGGLDSNTPLHYVATLEHAVPLAILGMVAVGAWVAVRRSRRSKAAASRV